MWDMLHRVRTIAFVVLSLGLYACDASDEDDFPLDGDEISMSDIASIWRANRAAFSPSEDGPAIEVDIVAEGGSVTLSIQANGRFTLTVSPPDRPVDVSTGQLGFDEDLLVVTYDDEPDDFELFGIQHAGDNLSLSGPAEYDFEGDGASEPARVELEMFR